jgi:hypothetical protein
MNGPAKIDFIKALMQFNGNICITHTTHNYDRNRGIEFSGYSMDGSNSPIRVTMDKNQVEAVMDCETIGELHECYIEMEYF